MDKMLALHMLRSGVQTPRTHVKVVGTELPRAGWPARLAEFVRSRFRSESASVVREDTDGDL